MAHIRPFRGVRPIPEMISRVASPPYDVLSSEEARERAKGNPYSFLHVIKPEIDLEPSIDLHDPIVYETAGKNFHELRKKKILIQDKRPCFYIYKLKMGSHQQTGVVAVASVEDYVENRIKKHEHTRPDKEEDRMNHIRSLMAQTGPVFLTYRYNGEIDLLIEEAVEKKPVYEFTGDHDVVHTLYIVDSDELIQKIKKSFEGVDALYVADGHHRSAAAVRVCDLLKKENPNHTGEEEYNYFLCVIFPDNQMQILDYNRVVRDLNGLSERDFLKKISANFDVKPYERGGPYRPDAIHKFGMYLGGRWYVMEARDGSFDSDDPVESLDVAILQNNLLSPVLGINNPRTDKRIEFVGGIRGMEELERLVNSGDFAVAFSMYPTGIAQLLSVADAGKVMPPKSTWFEPKLASGVVVHMLE